MNLKNKPIKYQLILHMIIIYITIVLIFLVAYNMVAGIMMSRSKTYTIDMTAKIKSNISTYYEEIKRITTYIAYNPYTQMFMQPRASFQEYLLYKDLDRVCSNFKDIKPNICDIIIYASDGDRYYSMSGDFSVDCFKNIIKNKKLNGEVYNSGFEGKQTYPGTEKQCLVYYTNSYSNNLDNDFGEQAGIVGVVVDNRQIFQEIEKISAGGSNNYYLQDKNGTTLYNRFSAIKESEFVKIRDKIQEKKLGDKRQETLNIDGSRVIVYSTYIPEIECTLVSFIPESDVYSELVHVKKIFLIIFVCAFIIMIIPMLYLLRNILSPLNELMEFMHNLEMGNLKNLKRKIEIDGYFEISEMARKFSSMLGEIDNLTHRLLDTHSRLYEAEIDKQRMEVSRKTAEIAFLRSQINPHFLFNTLESIKGVALDENAKRSFNMLRALATIFRFSVKGTDFVTLEEEMNIVDAYAQIQVIRFGGRINIKIDIGEHTNEIKIPKMIVQPLVENAIFHGLEGLEQNGTVVVASSCCNNELIIRVEDNGIGIEARQLEEMREAMESKTDFANNDGANNIGIANVNKRIKLIYGDKSGIDIVSDYGAGTAVTIRIISEEVPYV